MIGLFAILFGVLLLITVLTGLFFTFERREQRPVLWEMVMWSLYLNLIGLVLCGAGAIVQEAYSVKISVVPVSKTK